MASSVLLLTLAGYNFGVTSVLANGFRAARAVPLHLPPPAAPFQEMRHQHYEENGAEVDAHQAFLVDQILQAEF